MTEELPQKTLFLPNHCVCLAINESAIMRKCISSSIQAFFARLVFFDQQINTLWGKKFFQICWFFLFFTNGKAFSSIAPGVVSPKLRLLHNASPQQNGILSVNLMKPEFENTFVEKLLLSRRSRSTNSRCRDSAEKLFGLALHAYKKAKAAHDLRIRRSTIYHFNRKLTVEDKLKIIHKRLYSHYCDTISYPNLFEQNTLDIRKGIMNIIVVLQTEMSSLNVDFDSVSLSSCGSFPPNQQKPHSLVRMNVLNELFGMSKDIDAICFSAH